MAGKCKACHSPLKETIDARLAQGESVERLSVWLKTQGVSISSPSLNRHRSNHMGLTRHADGMVTSILEDHEPETLDTGIFIDTDKVMADIEKSLDKSDVFDSVVAERKRTQLLMERIVQKQLIIVHELQDQYTEGKAGYPDAQIRGLKTLLDIVNSLPTYTDKRLLSKIEKSGSIDHVKEIKKHAQEAAETINATYKPWDYLTTDLCAGAPRQHIEKIARVNFPSDEYRREEWVKDRVNEWVAIFQATINDTYLIEEQLHETIWDLIPESDQYTYEQQEEILLKIVEGLKAEYGTPENVPDETGGDDGLEGWIEDFIKYSRKTPALPGK